jgi:hypothetical protein
VGTRHLAYSYSHERSGNCGSEVLASSAKRDYTRLPSLRAFTYGGIMSQERAHICGNPSFDMFTCLACHPELAPKEPPVRQDPFEEAVKCATYSYDGPKLDSIWVSLHLKPNEFEEFKAFVKNRGKQ